MFVAVVIRQLSHVRRKPAFYLCENKDADQLCSNCAAGQHLCFCYTDRKIPLLPRSEVSSLLPSSVSVQPGLCQTWSETSKTGFHTALLNLCCIPFSDQSDSCSCKTKV